MGDVTSLIELARARDGLIDTTALVHECDLKLVRSERLQASARGHFLAYSATVIRGRSGWSRCATSAA